MGYPIVTDWPAGTVFVAAAGWIDPADIPAGHADFDRRIEWLQIFCHDDDGGPDKEVIVAPTDEFEKTTVTQ